MHSEVGLPDGLDSPKLSRYFKRCREYRLQGLCPAKPRDINTKVFFCKNLYQFLCHSFFIKILRPQVSLMKLI